jgi:ligand-binding SRPBCC domain-containing protein
LKLNRLYREQKINAGINEVWDYFSSPSNLPIITPKWLNFELVSQVPDDMYEGLIIEYKVSPILNIPFKWITEITYVNKPYFFVDEQRFGPYKFWHHKHFFKELDDGSTLMSDEVHYIVTFNFLDKMLIAKRLKSIFDYRFKKIEEIFNKR